MLGDQPRALEDLLEVALGEPLALGDHAEPVRARRLGRARVLEDLLGLHHRVHRRLGLGEARLGAEAAVLGAAAGLRVDERAHVGRVREALDARLPRALDQRLDLGGIFELAEAQRLLTADQRRHPDGNLRVGFREVTCAPGRVSQAAKSGLRRVRARGAALRLLPLLLAPERRQVEEVVRAAGHLGAARVLRVRVEDVVAVAQEAARARHLDRLLGLAIEVAVPAARAPPACGSCTRAGATDSSIVTWKS